MTSPSTLGRGGRRRAAVTLILTLIAGALAFVRPFGATAAPNEYVTVDDGVRIAINVRLPDGYVEGQQYPTLFEMSGYDGGSAEDGTLAKDIGEATGIPGLPLQEDSRQLSRRFNQDYVTIHASARGTGCSGGEFDLFSWRTALDGRFIIDEWIPQQPWSNGKVALLGHSYGGITGFMVTATQPKHLVAASVSGLIDDLYRGITYPGGVSNYGFPLLWTGAIRPAYDVLGGLAPGIVRDEQPDDTESRRQKCGENVANKSRTVTNDPLVQGTNDQDNDWWRSKSLITYAKQIAVPIHVTGAYQDEQTGPRGFTHLWEQVEGVPKRLVISNGDHNTQNPSSTGPEIYGDRKAWIDHFTRGVDGGFGPASEDRTSVTTLLETHRSGGTLVSNGRIDSAQFPLEGTQWQSWYLRSGNQLATSAPTGAELGDRYVSGSPRQSWSYQAGPTAGSQLTTPEGPDELNYRSAPLAADSTIVGPITANLFVQSTATDTDLFVELVDEGPDGSRTYLQRGMLKASHRAINAGLSDYTGAGHLYRPWRPHTNPTLITPGQTYEYLVEVFPVGHVFRAGHRIAIKVHTPPAVDSYYAYVPKRPAGVNTVLHDAAHPSRITLPVVATPALGPALPCGRQEAVRCIR